MSEFRALPKAAKAYVAAVVVGGCSIVVYSAIQLATAGVETQWFVLAALTLLTGSFTVKVPSTPVYISVSETFVFVAVILFGPPAGVGIVLIECLIISFWTNLRGSALHKILFNTAAPAIAIWLSAHVFFAVSGFKPYSEYPPNVHNIPLSVLFLPLATFTICYFLLTSGLVTIIVALEKNHSPLELWRRNFVWLSVNYFSGASVAAIIVTYSGQIDFSMLAVIIPLLVVFYLTFRTAMDRVDDTNKHLSELNRLYLSTIETLAMAIDAKDQITHGHIRRVQSYAVGLAKEIGIKDERDIKAIEAAALLHDMGKLAVPEYILNKPGKLTGAEFEKMKLHASVGADILSAIDFPYPVVPIVRHHHESWDGSGYPDGIKSTDIPIGARILSVVDCFDALTSDRPYRPKLPDEEAIRILLERRGNMYDPLVVDTFIKVYKQIAPEASSAVSLPKNALREITTSSASPSSSATSMSRLDDIAASADEMLTLYDLARALAGNANLSTTGDVIINHLRRLIPFAQSALFFYDVQRDEVVVKHAVGDISASIKGLRISLGERLSGWVAANRQTILNSDPVLDLGDAARAHEPRLRSCLSAPLLSGDEQLVGVLSLYATGPDAFNEEHRRVIGVAAKQIAHTFKCTAEFEKAARPDEVTGLPGLRQLERLVESGDRSSLSTRSTLLVVDVVHLKDINTRYGRKTGDEALRHVVKHARGNLRVADILFRHADDEFVALLNDADVETADSIAARIRETIRVNPLNVNGTVIPLDVHVTALNAESSGASFNERISLARTLVHDQMTIH